MSGTSLRTALTVSAGLALALGGVAVPATAAPAPSARASQAALPAFTAAPTPTVTGWLSPGYVLTASAGAWSPAPSHLTYTFYRMASNGYRVQVQSGTSRTYRLQNGDNNHRITVTVTAERAGYATTSRTSGTTLHVLTPAQRRLFNLEFIPSDKADWHDLYFRGTATTGKAIDVSRPRSRAAYVEYMCSTPGRGAATPYNKDRPERPSTVEPVNGSTVSTIWGSSLPLTTVSVRCDGAWSLVVRPAPSAPITYATATGTDDQAMIYTGPAVDKTFSAVPRPGAASWEQHFDFAPNGIYLQVPDGGSSSIRRKTLAGPIYLYVRGTGTTSWSMF